MQQIDHPKKIEIRDYINRTVAIINATHRNPHLKVSYHLEIHPIECSPSTAINIAQLIKELIQNALRHGFKGKPLANIKISLTQRDNACSLVVDDDGNGIDENADPYKSSSSGFSLVSSIVEKLNGSIRVIRSHGTRFEIEFPHV